jgi:hypothetical protein
MMNLSIGTGVMAQIVLLKNLSFAASLGIKEFHGSSPKTLMIAVFP